ncbi:MAG: hypothetical protein WCF96_04255 [Eubacteriales bacterium]
MKKIFSILIALMMVFSTGAVAFATDGTTVEKDKPAKVHVTSVKTQENSKVKPDFTMLKDLRAQILANRTTIVAIKADIKVAHTAVMAKIKELRNSNPAITEDQITAIKALKEEIKMGRGTYESNHKGVLLEERAILKTAHANKDREAMKSGLENIIKEQNLKITDLKAILHNLNDVLDALNDIK